MIFGINATRSAVVIAETRGTGDKFAITTIRPIPFEVRSGDDLAELLRCLVTIFDRGGRGASPTIALLKCSSGRFGSCLEAIKAEAITELAAQRGIGLSELAMDGEHPLVRLSGVVQLTDYASVYLAIASGIDPSQTAAMTDLQARIE